MRSTIAKILALTLVLGLVLPAPLFAVITATSNKCTGHASSSSSTVQCTMPGNTTAGNTVAVCVYWNDGTEAHLSSVTETLGGGSDAFTLRSTTYISQASLSLKGADSISIANSTTPQYTANFSVSVTDSTISAQEFTNIAAFDTAITNPQTNVGMGTDADTSGATATRAQANEVVWGCSMSSNNAVTINAGTGYTQSTAIGTGYATTEYQVFSAVGTQAATWTLGSGTTNNMFSFAAAYKDVVPGGGGAVPHMLPLLGVGR